MTTKERIIAIRLAHKTDRNPGYANQIGVAANNKKTDRSLVDYKKIE